MSAARTPRGVAVLVALLAGSLLLFVLVGGLGGRVFGPRTAGPSAYSVSAVGYKAAFEFLRRGGLGVAIRRDPSEAAPGPGAPLLLAEPELRPGDAAVAALLDEAYAAGAPVVFVLPKRIGSPNPGRPKWVGSAVPLPRKAAASWLDALLGEGAGERLRREGPLWKLCAAAGGETFRVHLEDAQGLAPADEAGLGLEPLLACGDRWFVARRAADDEAERPEIVVVTDPDLLNTHGLARGDHAALLETLARGAFGAGGGPAHGLVVDEAIHGFTTRPTLIEELLRFPLVLATAHALLLLALLLAAGSARFGRPRPAPPGLVPGHAALIESTARLLDRRRLAGASLERYAPAALRRALGRLGLPAPADPAEAVARIDALARARGRAARGASLWEQARAAGAGGNEAAALDAARALHDWTREVTDVGRRDAAR